jgi:hypothetical protein
MFRSAVFLGQVALALGQVVPPIVEKQAKEAMDLARKKIEDLNRKGKEQGGGLTDDQWKEFKKWDDVWKTWKKVLEAYRQQTPRTQTPPRGPYPVTYPCPMCEPPVPMPIPPPREPPRVPQGGGMTRVQPLDMRRDGVAEGACPPGQFRPAPGAPCRGSVGAMPGLPGGLAPSGGGVPVAAPYLGGGRIVRGGFGGSLWM